MRLTFFVVWKSWVSNPLRTLLSILGVALGIAIVVAIHVVDHNTIESQLRQKRSDFGRVDLELLPRDAGADTEAVRSALMERSDLAAVGLLHQGVADGGWKADFDQALPGSPDQQSPATQPPSTQPPSTQPPNSRPLGKTGDRIGAQLAVYGVDATTRVTFGHYSVVAGRDLQAADDWLPGVPTPPGVLVGPGLAEAAPPGSKLTIARTRAAPRSPCRNGVRIVEDDGGAALEPFEVEVVVRGVIADARIGQRNFGLCVVSGLALAQQLCPSQRTLFHVQRGRGVDIDRLRRDLSTDFDVLDERAALLGESSDERAFRNGVKMLGCLALVLGMFVVFQTLSQSLVERFRQIGLLRCLGASRGQIGGAFLLDALGMAVVGAALGVLVGIGLTALLIELGVSSLGRGKNVEFLELPITPILWTALLGVVFTLAGAAFPLFKARTLSALDVLSARGLQSGHGRDVLRGVNLFLFVMLVAVLPGAYLAMTPLLSEEGREMLIVLAQLGGMILVFGTVLLLAPRVVQWLGRLLLVPFTGRFRLPAFLVRKALLQTPGRFAASVCGLAVVLLALVALKSVTWSLASESREFGARASDHRLYLRGDPVASSDLVKLAELPGVRGVTLFQGVVNPRFPLRGVAPEALFGAERPLESVAATGMANRYTTMRSLIVSTRLAHLRRLVEGDSVVLQTDAGPVAYLVLKITDRVGYFPDERAWAVTAPEWLRRDFCTDPSRVAELALTLEPGGDVPAILAAVRERHAGFPWAKTGAEVTAYNLRDVRADFRLFDILLALILALSGVGLINGMTIAALGRAREIGVLRALGMSKSALRWMFVIEGGVIAVISSILAIALAVPFGILVVNGLNAVSGLEAPFSLPYVYLIATPAIALLLGLVAAWLPGLRAVREDPASAVRYE